MTTNTGTPTPILDGLILGGAVYVSVHDELVGIASDGVEVNLGNVHNKPLAEAYLTDHPTPDTW